MIKYVKLLVCITLISGQYSYAMDMTSFAKNSPKKNSATDNSDTLDKNEEQLSLSGQDLLDYVNQQLDALQQEIAFVADPLEAKKLVAERLVKIAYITNTDLSGLANIVDQAIDIVAQDIASQDADQDESQVVIQAENESSGKFSQALVLIAQGLKSAITVPLRTFVGLVAGATAGAAAGGSLSLGVAAVGATAGAVTGVGLTLGFAGLAVGSSIAQPAPFGAMNKNDSFATKAVKLLPNILSRTLSVVISAPMSAAIGALSIVPLTLGGLVSGVQYANLTKEGRNSFIAKR